jgi:hypothetical protein
VLTKKLGIRQFAVLTVSAIAAAAAVMGVTGNVIIAIVCGAVVEVAFGLIQPLFQELYNRQVAVSDRATQLSVYAMLSEVFSFGLSFVMALIAGRSFLAPFLLSSGLCAAGIILFLLCYRNVRFTENRKEIS